MTLSSDNPHAPLEATAQIDRRIDYVLARSGSAGGRVEVDAVFLAGMPVAGVHPSDHLAVVADLSIGAPPRYQRSGPERAGA